MKHVNALVFLGLLLSSYAFAQDTPPTVIGVDEIKVSQEDNGFTCYRWNKPRNWGSRQAIDTARFSVTYDYKFAVKAGNEMRKLSDIHVLQIGPHANRSYSLYSEKIDSIAFNYLMSLGQQHLDALRPDWTPSRLERTLYSWIPDGMCPLYLDVYTLKDTDEWEVSSRFLYDEYLYSERIEQMEWRILPDTDTILGIPCNLAQTDFRGRKWNAWFTFDIPFGFGPWKFYGLPGLILRLSDDEDLFCWQAIGLSESQDPVVRHIPGYSSDERIHVWIPDRQIKKCSWKEMDRLWKRFWNAPLSIRALDDMEAVFVDDKNSLVVKVSDPVPNDYYPQIEKKP